MSVKGAFSRHAYLGTPCSSRMRSSSTAALDGAHSSKRWRRGDRKAAAAAAAAAPRGSCPCPCPCPGPCPDPPSLLSSPAAARCVSADTMPTTHDVFPVPGGPCTRHTRVSPAPAPAPVLAQPSPPSPPSHTYRMAHSWLGLKARRRTDHSGGGTPAGQATSPGDRGTGSALPPRRRVSALSELADLISSTNRSMSSFARCRNWWSTGSPTWCTSSSERGRERGERGATHLVREQVGARQLAQDEAQVGPLQDGAVHAEAPHLAQQAGQRGQRRVAPRVPLLLPLLRRVSRHGPVRRELVEDLQLPVHVHKEGVGVPGCEGLQG